MQSFENLIIALTLLISMSLIPLLVILVLSAYLYHFFKKNYNNKIKYVVKPYWSTFITAIPCLLLTFLSGRDLNYLFEYICLESNTMDIGNISVFKLKYLFSFQPVLWALICLLIGFSMLNFDITRYDRNQDIIKRKEREKNKIDSLNKINLEYHWNLFIAGKTGAGKTVAITNFIQSRIQDEQFGIIIDGKGEVGEYSLYDIITKLCIKHHRKLYIINQTIPEETHAYNPFMGCNETQIKDMLINMSHWTEEHYKNKAGEYYQAIAQFMIQCQIPISFSSLTKFCDPDLFKTALDMYKDVINKDDYKYYLSVLSKNGEVAMDARSRFTIVYKGIGKKLFKDTVHTFNIKTAFKERAIVLVLLNKLQYTEFAESIGYLVLNDIKNLLGEVSTNKGFHEKFFCVYDEVSAYFHPMLVDIVNKSRSLGGFNIVATQTIADMDIVDEDARRAIIGNMHGFYLLKQNDDKSAEDLAAALGTKTINEVSTKFNSYGKTGDGVSKIGETFKVHPNDLKDLPLEVGIWVDTREEPVTPRRIKLPYLDLKDVPEYHFKPL